MNSQADKNQANKNQPAAYEVTQKQNGSKPDIQFTDNRPEALAQRKLQSVINNSPLVKQLKAHQKQTANFASETPGQKTYSNEESLIEAPVQKQEKYLPQQAWPAVQQAQRRVNPSVQMREKLFVSDGVSSGNEADLMGAKTVQSNIDTATPKHSNRAAVTTHQLRTHATVQRVTDLHVQQGPSCWLFVLEAVAASQGVNTKSLKMIMHSYASGEDADRQVSKAKKEPIPRDISRRQAALEVTAVKLTAMVDSLNDYKNGGNDHFNSDIIAEKIVRKKARQKLESENSVDSLVFVGGQADTQNVIDAYVLARDRATSLVNITNNQPDDVGALLQSGSQEITRDQAFTDIVATLQVARLPAYMAIRKRFKPTGQELADAAGGIIDFTARSTKQMEDTSHAVLLDSYNDGDKTIIYKDPNYGNPMIKVKLGQLKEMAGDGRVLIRPFFKEGASKSKLADVVDL